MAKCPKCGKDVKTPKKTWKMAGKPDKKGKRTQLTIALMIAAVRLSAKSQTRKRFKKKTSISLFLFFF